MLDITRPLPRRIEFEGRKYALDLSFNRVLDAYRLLREPELFDEEKARFILALLVKESHAPPQMLQKLFDEYLSITKKTSGKSTRVVDFEQDGIYLYSSFMHDYGIDLIRQRNRLHWWEFVSLFQGLSEQTKMREVMRIRSQKIPERTKYNGAYIDSLIELKAYYALEISQEEREQNFRQGLAGLAAALKARAMRDD